MIKRYAGTVAVVASLSACTTVSHVPLSQEMSAQLKGKSITTSQYPAADFTAFTAGKAAFALMGAAAMISEGNEIVKTNNIEDPALKISQELAVKLKGMRNMTIVSNRKTTATDDDISVLLSTYPKTDYLVDVKTLGWMFNYYPTDWSHYKVTYSARFRLIESSTQKVITETACQSVQGDDKNPPTKEQLLENQAELLKVHLGKAASACVEVISKDLLRL